MCKCMSLTRWKYEKKIKEFSMYMLASLHYEHTPSEWSSIWWGEQIKTRQRAVRVLHFGVLCNFAIK